VDETTGEVVKKPQELSVQIGQHVELGANTCVDRGSWRDTVIGDHCKARVLLSPLPSPGGLYPAACCLACVYTNALLRIHTPFAVS